MSGAPGACGASLVAVAVVVVRRPGADTAAAPAAASAAGFTADQDDHRGPPRNGKDDVVDTRNVSSSVSEHHRSARSPGDPRQLDRRPSDRRHPRRPELRRRQAGGVPDGAPAVPRRGLGARSPAEQRLSPQTCWTHDVGASATRQSYNSAFPPWRIDRYATRGPARSRRGAAGASGRPPASRPARGRALGAVRRGRRHDATPAAPAAAPGMATGGGHVGRRLGPAEQRDVRRHRRRTARARPTSTSGPPPTTPRWAARPTVACSLVAVPIMGISCDATAAALPAADQPARRGRRRGCRLPRRPGDFAPGQVVQPHRRRGLAVSGALWWSRVELAQPDQRPADVRAAVERLRRRRQRTAGRRLRLGAADRRRRPSGRRNSAWTASCSLHSTSRLGAGGAQPARDRQHRGGLREHRPTRRATTARSSAPLSR